MFVLPTFPVAQEHDQHQGALSALFSLCVYAVVSVWKALLSCSTRPALLEPLRPYEGISLVVQWLRIDLAMQGMWVWSLVGELRSHTHYWATKPACGNQRIHALQWKIPRDASKIPSATTKTQHSQTNYWVLKKTLLKFPLHCQASYCTGAPLLDFQGTRSHLSTNHVVRLSLLWTLSSWSRWRCLILAVSPPSDVIAALVNAQKSLSN